MASIKFNKKLFEKEIGKLTDEMQQKIALFGTTVEDISEDEIELDITPNRPDLLSYQNFKRSFIAFLGNKTGLREYKLRKPEKDYTVNIDPSVKNFRPYTVCAIVKSLKLDDNKIKEIIDIQEKLHITAGRRRKKFAIGIYPLDKIKLPISLKAIEPDKIKFVPLEMEKEMSGLQILQRHPTGKEYAHLLAGKSKFPVFVDSDENVLSMPPIINSNSTGKVTNKTKDIFIECSGFDLEILKKCLNILVVSFSEMGGKIYQMNVLGLPKKDNLTPNLDPDKMKVSLSNVNKILGLNLNEKELKVLLEKMGHNYISKTQEVEIASWRTDILHEVDIVEDVLIAYGYDKLEPEIPKISTIGQEDPFETFKKKISEILSGLGLLEISNYHLTTKKDQFSKMGVGEKQEKGFIELEESKTENNILRKDLRHQFLRILSENVDSEYPQKIFECGRIFLDEGSEVVEKEKLCISIAPGNFTIAKQVLNYLFKMVDFKIEELLISDEGKFPNYFIDGRVGEIILKGKKIGLIGEIHPRILKNWKIKMPVALFEIDLELLS
jgi:phenylalanyl-tRNA synthetase beta chain